MAFYRVALARDILQRPVLRTTTYYCIHMLVTLSRISFELMPHNDNYLRNILRQRLWYCRPVGKGSGEAPEKI